MVTAAALHPAERRRLVAAMPPIHDHDIEVRPLGGQSVSSIVGATEQDFLGAVMADISSDNWDAALAQRRDLRRNGNVLELTVPMHRRFHIALFEVVCRQPGYPRVDPRRLDGMGLVLRRVERDSSNHAVLTGWMSDGPAKRGWLPLSFDRADPDPARRNAVRRGAAGHIDRLLAQHRPADTLAEQVMPLFVAPPDVCAARGRTILYGVLPITSNERSETPPPVPNYSQLPDGQTDAMIAHLSSYLLPRPGITIGHGGLLLDPKSKPLQLPPNPSGSDTQFNSFGLFLQQLAVELDAFGQGPAARALMAVLGQVWLDVAVGFDDNAVSIETISAADFLPEAAAVLLNGDPNNNGWRLPYQWPPIGDDLGNRLTQAALTCLSERFAAVRPLTPKFDDTGWTYQVRAFARALGPDGCPSKIVWSQYSPEFRILPWWDGDGPATKIALPDPRDFKKLKPNVTFQLPPSLAGLLQGDMKKLSDGEDPGGNDGMGIYWLCSFSLPIITICAFISLNIFLGLFNIIFSWMAFIKICIPIPVPKSSNP